MDRDGFRKDPGFPGGWRPWSARGNDADATMEGLSLGSGGRVEKTVSSLHAERVLVRRVAVIVGLLVAFLILGTGGAAGAESPHGGYSMTTGSCSSCHRVHGAGGPKLLFRPDEKVVCYSCHDGTASADNARASFGEQTIGQSTLASRHPVPEGLLTCTNCHTPHQGPPENPRSLMVGPSRATSGNAVCAACHGPGSTAKGGDMATRGTGTPHAAMPGPASGTGISCSRCHEEHGSTIASLIRTEIADSQEATHTVTGVNNTLCYACHGAALRAYPGETVADQGKHMTTFSSTVALTQSPGLAYGPGNCMNCHEPHGTGLSSYGRLAGNAQCVACHDSPALFYPSQYSYQGQAAYASSGHRSASCDVCHAVHGSADGQGGVVSRGLVGAEPALCARDGCHGGADFVGAVNIKDKFAAGTSATSHHDVDPAVQASTGARIACSSCHDPHKDGPTSAYSDPAAIGASMATDLNDYIDSGGSVYVLVGAKHDGVTPTISNLAVEPTANTVAALAVDLAPPVPVPAAPSNTSFSYDSSVDPQPVIPFQWSAVSSRDGHPITYKLEVFRSQYGAPPISPDFSTTTTATAFDHSLGWGVYQWQVSALDASHDPIFSSAASTQLSFGVNDTSPLVDTGGFAALAAFGATTPATPEAGPGVVLATADSTTSTTASSAATSEATTAIAAPASLPTPDPAAPSTDTTSTSLPHFSVNTDALSVVMTSKEGTATAATVVQGYESAGASPPEPSTPGAAVLANTLAAAAAVDGGYWITALTSVDGESNWHLVTFSLSDAVSGVKSLRVSWRGHGEPTPGYPTSLYLWNFATAAWDLQQSTPAGEDTDLSAVKESVGDGECLSCHGGTTPSDVTIPSTVTNIGATWGGGTSGSSGAYHGARAGTGRAGSLLVAPYRRGEASISCQTCHDPHGTANIDHFPTSLNGRTGIAVGAPSQAKELCLSCHQGSVSTWHAECISCHSFGDHGNAPQITESSDCLECHRHDQPTLTHTCNGSRCHPGQTTDPPATVYPLF